MPGGGSGPSNREGPRFIRIHFFKTLDSEVPPCSKPAIYLDLFVYYSVFFLGSLDPMGGIITVFLSPPVFEKVIFVFTDLIPYDSPLNHHFGDRICFPILFPSSIESSSKPPSS